jgi:hypothetical protein
MKPYSEATNVNDVFQTLAGMINKTRAKEIIRDVTPHLKTLFHTGEWFTHCYECNKEITKDNPGVAVSWKEKNQSHVMHLCNNCFAEPHSFSRYVEDMKIEKYTGL